MKAQTEGCKEHFNDFIAKDRDSIGLDEFFYLLLGNEKDTFNNCTCKGMCYIMFSFVISKIMYELSLCNWYYNVYFFLIS